jgi:protein ImuB
LPRAGFATRFGPRLLEELDEGLGRRPAPRRRHVVPERFDERLELPAGAEAVAVLQPSLERLLARLEAFLRARASGIRALRVDLLHRARPPTRLSLALARMAGDAEALRELLDERLGRCRLAEPVVALRLRSGVLSPLQLRDAGLFERGRSADPEATARLLDLLRARLGHDAVFGVLPVPEHRPERAFRIAEPGNLAGLPVPWPATRPARPLWMLADPQPLDGWAGALVTGPERIETGWWDGHDVRRDYYVALSRAGVRLWIFRERPPGQGWFLHGVFG